MGKYRRAGRPRAKPAGKSVLPNLHGHSGRVGDFWSRSGFGNTLQRIVRQQRRKFRTAQEQRLSTQIVPAAVYPYPVGILRPSVRRRRRYLEADTAGTYPNTECGCDDQLAGHIRPRSS